MRKTSVCPDLPKCLPTPCCFLQGLSVPARNRFSERYWYVITCAVAQRCLQEPIATTMDGTLESKPKKRSNLEEKSQETLQLNPWMICHVGFWMYVEHSLAWGVITQTTLQFPSVRILVAFLLLISGSCVWSLPEHTCRVRPLGLLPL